MKANTKMIINDAYATTLGSLVVTDGIRHQIEMAIARDSIQEVDLKVRPTATIKSIFLTGILESEQGVHAFSHPMMVVTRTGQSYLCSDIRIHLNTDIRKATVADVQNSIDQFVRNRVDFNFAKSRHVLNLAWLSGQVGHIKNGLKFASEVYASLISQTISRAFGLDFENQLRIQIAAHHYYNCQFTNDNVIDDDTLLQWSSHIIESTKSNSSIVMEVLKQMKVCTNLNDFCLEITRICDNQRLRGFNQVALITLLKATWFGTDAKNIIGVMLEHPPTWVAVLYAVINSRTFKRSDIFTHAERLGGRGKVKDFIVSYADLVNQYTIDKLATESADRVNYIDDFLKQF